MMPNTDNSTVFSVTVQPSQRSFVTSAEETILAAAVRQGISLPYGCKDGACGSCKCRLVSGNVQLGPHQSKALSADEQSSGLILTCCATAGSDLVLESKQVTELGAFPIKKMPARIASMQKKSNDVVVLQLQLPANEAFNYHAGQYIEFILRDGARRSYSMASALRDGCPLEFHIRHMTGGKFTDYVFGSMKEKEIVRVEGPYGSFFLREDSAKPIILLASGTGFAPIKAILEHMAAKGIARSTTLYWGGRRPSDLYMQDWVEQTARTMPHFHFIPVISDPTADDNWLGRGGFVHRAVLEDFPDLSGYQVYACGAPVVIESAKRDFVAKAKLPTEEFFADAFTSEADKANA